MNFYKVLLHSPLKQRKINSILKGRSQLKDQTEKQQKGLSTSIRHSVTFKQPLKEQNEHNVINQFIQTSNKQKKSSNKKKMPVTEAFTPEKIYSKSTFLKDVNNINHLYNEILCMATSNNKNLSEKTINKQLIQMTKTIQDLVHQNIELKSQVDEKHKIHCDLHELAEYLDCSFEQLTKDNIIDAFLEDYCSKQEQWAYLQERCNRLPQQPKMRVKGLTQNQVRDRQKKCQLLKKNIEKQKAAVKKLQKEEKLLLKGLYNTQRQLSKNDQLCSTIKLKINQLEIDRQYQQTKKNTSAICKETGHKENIYPTNQYLKHLKIQNKERLRSKSSLAKFIKK